MVAGKNGMWRIVEASIAILIIALAILTFFSRQKIEYERDFSSLAKPILNEIAKNATLREIIVNDNDDDYNAEINIMGALSQKITNPRLSYNVSICDLNSANCGNPPDIEEDIYSDERVIGATLEKFNPKIVKIYIWRTQ